MIQEYINPRKMYEIIVVYKNGTFDTIPVKGDKVKKRLSALRSKKTVRHAEATPIN